MASMLLKCRHHSAIVQLSSTTAAAYSFMTSTVHVLASSSPIIGLDIWDSRSLIWSESNAELFRIQESGHRLESAFPSSGREHFALHRNFIIKVEGLTIQVLDMEGCPKIKLELNEPQGKVVDLDVCENSLLVATENGYIHMWRFNDEGLTKTCLSDIGRKVSNVTKYPCSTVSIKCNYDGSKVSFTFKSQVEELDSTLYIYDTILDRVFHHDFRSEKMILLAHCWDSDEFQQFVCQVRHINDEMNALEDKSNIVTFFLDHKEGIVKRDKIDVEYDKFDLLGKHEPYVYLFEKLNHDHIDLQKTPVISKVPMGILATMENADGRTHKELLVFCDAILAGNVAQAYKFIESIKDQSILKKVAYYCMTHGFLHAVVACFAQMGRAYAVCAVTNLNYGDPSLREMEAKAAAAVQLGCIEDAEKIYIECQNYGLLSQFYQAFGNWEKAIQMASKHDPINLKNIHHAYAKSLESIGNIEKAIHHYEASCTHRYEVPRMLYSIGKLEELKKYVDEKRDSTLYRWWANYCEAKNLLLDAIDYYKLAGDVSSSVKLYACLGDMTTAENIVAETCDPAATFHLGQQYQKQGNIERALKLFAKAGMSDSAAHLAMKHGIEKELLSLALRGTKKTMLSSAKFFEDKGCLEEAVLLYEKGGDLEKAMSICIQHQLFDALKEIANNLNEETDPLLLARCGDCLLAHEQFEKAVLLLIAAGQHCRAFDLCIDKNVRITDKMIELFSKQISEENSANSKQLLTALAEICESQGSFHLACKTYTHAGDKVKAMKALVKSRDTDKILNYANVSRNKQLYVLAAGYLQTLDWHSDANIMKKIVQMYTKAAEMESLAAFYEACAQIEIDGFRDYEKALGAMKEAWKFLSKVNQSPRRDSKARSLKRRMEEVERFVEARRLAKSDPNGMIATCTHLLSELSLHEDEEKQLNREAALRIGDLYALLIEYYYKQGNLHFAYQKIREMTDCKLPPREYIDPSMLESVYKANGVRVSEEEEEDGSGRETGSDREGIKEKERLHCL